MTIGLDQISTIYARDASGVYNVVLTTELPCRLVQVRGSFSDQQGRAELARMRRFLWDPGYEMPAYSQVEVAGERWNPIEGTENAPRGPFGMLHHRSVDVVRSGS